MKTLTPNEGQKKMLQLLLAGGVSFAAAVSGVFLTAPSEGLETTTYVDPVGVSTVCYGHTGEYAKEGASYTATECVNILLKDLSDSEKSVDAIIKVPLNVYQRVALVDFTFNLGPTNLRNSTMAKLFNEGKYEEGCNQLSSWVYAKKRKLPGLVARRDAELQFCLGNVVVADVNQSSD